MRCAGSKESSLWTRSWKWRLTESVGGMTSISDFMALTSFLLWTVALGFGQSRRAGFAPTSLKKSGLERAPDRENRSGIRPMTCEEVSKWEWYSSGGGPFPSLRGAPDYRVSGITHFQYRTRRGYSRGSRRRTDTTSRDLREQSQRDGEEDYLDSDGPNMISGAR